MIVAQMMKTTSNFSYTAICSKQCGTSSLVGFLKSLDSKFQTATENCEVILYGGSELDILANRLLMEATLQFIKNNKRFF